MSKPLDTIIETLHAMLEGRMSWISGAHAICGSMPEAGLFRDREFDPFIGVVSETDALPIDPKLRELWNEDALLALQPKIDAKELWARLFLKPKCERLLARLSGSSPSHEGGQ